MHEGYAISMQFSVVNHMCTKMKVLCTSRRTHDYNYYCHDDIASVLLVLKELQFVYGTTYMYVCFADGFIISQDELL